MKRLIPTLAVAPLWIALQAQAGEACGFSIACPASGLPSQTDVVRVFDEHNLGKVYELRQRVHTLAWRECRAGAAFVEIAATPERWPRVIPRESHPGETWKPGDASTHSRLTSTRHPARDGTGY